MELLYTQEERQRMEIYSEYLKKIPDLLKQLETVEQMYQKAVMEEGMLLENESAKEQGNHSVELYKERLARIKKQCEERAADIKEQCKLILELKAQIESDSSLLKKVSSSMQGGTYV